MLLEKQADQAIRNRARRQSSQSRRSKPPPVWGWCFSTERDNPLVVEGDPEDQEQGDAWPEQHVQLAFARQSALMLSHSEAMPVKTDRNDARGLAQLMRLGWFRPVHCKSMAAQEVRALLTARKLVQSKLYDIEMSLRGILRGFGLKVGPTTSRSFAARVNHLAAGHPSLEMVAEALLSTHAAALCAFKNLEKNVRQISRADARVRLLMSTPGVGPLVALTYVSAIDDPKRFTSSKRVGAHFGLTPKKYQSGETDISGRISKIGDSSVAPFSMRPLISS